MRAVAERLVGRRTTAAERSDLGARCFITITVLHRQIAIHQ